MITLGIKPGILLGLIGFIGSKIKLGEKLYLIEHGSVQKPKLFEILSTISSGFPEFFNSSAIIFISLLIIS